MKINEVAKSLEAKIVCGEHRQEEVIEKGFSSDLMSDVLRIDTEHLLLITGMANLQTIRTAEMADISYILFVRNKQISDEMLELAKENDLVLLRCPYSLFRASGLLFEAGLKPVY
ncbi:hypothetical protein EYV94_06850 [Puteibacter caeruleilacunae]|nr:hypothetical protein EYV94_06850 [Puteibacter caeruleilacunae]